MTLSREHVSHTCTYRTLDYKVLNATMNLSNRRSERIIVVAEQRESRECLLTFHDASRDKGQELIARFSFQFLHLSLSGGIRAKLINLTVRA